MAQGDPDVPNRVLYEMQVRSDVTLTQMSADLAALTSRVDVQLAHGSRKMDELAAAGAAVSGRVTVLEQARWKAVGAAGAIGAIAGGGAGSFLSWLLARHP